MHSASEIAHSFEHRTHNNNIKKNETHHDLAKQHQTWFGKGTIIIYIMSSQTDNDKADKDSSSAEVTSSSSEAAVSPSTGPQESTSAPADSDNTPTGTPTSQPQASNDPNRKVKVHFVPVGSAPILKKSKFQIGADQRFAAVHTFLRKLLKLNASSDTQPPPPLFLYLTSAFCPSQEELVGELEECFAKRGELIVHYSLQEAWGWWILLMIV